MTSLIFFKVFLYNRYDNSLKNIEKLCKTSYNYYIKSQGGITYGKATNCRGKGG